MAIHAWYNDTEDIATRRKTVTSKETDKQTENNIDNNKFRCHSVYESECVGGGGGSRRMNLHNISVCVHNEHQGQKP